MNLTRQLQTLQSTPSTPARTANQLTQLRRLLEMLTVTKEKLSKVNEQLEKVQGKYIWEIPMDSLVKSISAYDWDMFIRLIRTDFHPMLSFNNTSLNTYSTSSTNPIHFQPDRIITHGNTIEPPHSLKSCLDFAFYLRRLVQVTL